MPAIVVPPGEETMFFMSDGFMPVSSISLAVPSKVCADSLTAVSLLRPIFTPPSASASAKTAANAGPLPLRPVTASISFSSCTTSTVPSFVKRSVIDMRSSSVLNLLKYIPKAPSWTTAGLFGITLVIFSSFFNVFCIKDVFTPAAIDI